MAWFVMLTTTWGLLAKVKYTEWHWCMYGCFNGEAVCESEIALAISRKTLAMWNYNVFGASFILANCCKAFSWKSPTSHQWMIHANARWWSSGWQKTVFPGHVDGDVNEIGTLVISTLLKTHYKQFVHASRWNSGGRNEWAQHLLQCDWISRMIWFELNRVCTPRTQTNKPTNQTSTIAQQIRRYFETKQSSSESCVCTHFAFVKWHNITGYVCSITSPTHAILIWRMAFHL